jgi:signal transduction histidine kinase
VAYELHDGFLRDVIGAQMMLEGICAEPTASPEAFNYIRKLLQKAIAEGRRLISELRPMIIEEKGIVAAIGYLASEERAAGRLDIEFTADVQFTRLAPLLEGTIFRIVQEAISNIKRHSQADAAQIHLEQQGAMLYLEIRDRGVGFDCGKRFDDHFGLEGIRERARLFGGQATITSAPGEGTLVQVELPLNAELPEAAPTD